MATAYSTTSALPGYEITTDPDRLNVDLIYGFLSTSYWAQGRSRAVVERSIRGSIPFGVYLIGGTEAPGQVAFGRVITDTAVFAYLADVFVVPAHRGRGIAKGLSGCRRSTSPFRLPHLARRPRLPTPRGCARSQSSARSPTG